MTAESVESLTIEYASPNGRHGSATITADAAKRGIETLRRLGVDGTDGTSSAEDKETSLAEAIADALEAAPGILKDHETALRGIVPMAREIHDLPPYLPLRAFDGIAECDLFARAVTLVDVCRELDWLHGKAEQIEWVFYTRPRSSKRRVVCGSAKAIGAKERLLAREPRWWRIEISLPYWLLATEDERYRLLHHELCHLGLDVDEDGQLLERPYVEAHDVEDFASTVGRFGAFGDVAVRLARAAREHPTWKYDAEGTGHLFPAWTLPAEEEE